MAVSGVNGLAAAAAGTGGLLIWSGIKGANISKTLRSVLGGKQPAGADPGLAITGSFADTPTGSATSGLPGTPSGTGSFTNLPAYTHAELMQLWQANGGSAQAANNAACHAIQESSGNPKVTSPNPDGGTNVGLWQLDTKGVGAGHTVAQLQDPNTNARLTVMHTANGTNWSQWATSGC